MLNLKSFDSRKNKLFIKYCFIGVLSIVIELIVRNFFIYFDFNQILTLILPLTTGIFFAFICNIKFNFNIPRYYYYKSFFYFSLISILSFTIQFILSKIILFQGLNYEFSRLVMSGLVFIVAYNFHIKFSFRRNKKVGVAIYLDKNENIKEIFSKVGFHPDYIHIDMVDKSMNPKVNDPDLTKFEEIKKIWPNHKIETHIMSKDPKKYIDKLSVYSDVIYFHYEIDENIKEVQKLILNKGVKPGIVIHSSKQYKDISSIIKDFQETLLLCIDNPGESGQKFNNESFSFIEQINLLRERSGFLLCVDGGLSLENIKKIDCDKIVSASNVFQSINPKKQIINLQKILNN